ncbi:hypothetical protein KCP71_10295 [Salmonella enterica subsp. enterica]|nr:hypothetical protein KCP71_10295 [Salmonella enterica subsp. enterica]
MNNTLILNSTRFSPIYRRFHAVMQMSLKATSRPVKQSAALQPSGFRNLALEDASRYHAKRRQPSVDVQLRVGRFNFTPRRKIKIATLFRQEISRLLRGTDDC